LRLPTTGSGEKVHHWFYQFIPFLLLLLLMLSQVPGLCWYAGEGSLVAGLIDGKFLFVKKPTFNFALSVVLRCALAPALKSTQRACSNLS
jgi:hypothetical protein